MIKQDRLVQTLIDLIKIDSPSGEEKAIAQELKKRFEVLGGSVEIDSLGNLIVRFGSPPDPPAGGGGGESLLLSAHLDTVEPGRNIQPVINGDIMTSDGKTVLGADDKAGIAVILEGITSVKESGGKLVPIEVVLSVDEETGSKGAKGLDHKKLLSKKAVVFDGDEQVFLVNTAAPGYYGLDMTITGRAAHAGVEPEKGISAIKIAADLITRLRLGRIDEETTANIGMISGGSARNAVPEKVEIKGEFRSRNGEKLEKQVKDFENIVLEIRKLYPEAKLDYTLNKHFDSFSIPDDDPFVLEINKALKDVGLTGQIGRAHV